MGERRALLITDLVDSTALGRRLGDAAAGAWWQEHDRRARDLLLRCSGREIDKSDGFLLLFDSAADAATYAAAYHDVLAGLPLQPKARIGLHVGEVTLRANAADDVARGAKPLEVDGVGKSIAARIMSVAAGGRTLASAAARDDLGPQPRCRSCGHWRFKGLEEPMELFEIGVGVASGAAPAESGKAYRVHRVDGAWLPVRSIRHSLPAQRDSFIGRGAELRMLDGALDSGARLVSLLGPGGSGKTRLALEYARARLGDFPGGAWFCDLAPARDEADIVQATARGLQLDLQRGDAMEAVGAAIAGRGECLLLLDNFEQVTRHAEATLGRWLDRAPEVRVIVTSRERLRIGGEHALWLEPMPTADAASLFVDRVAAACGGMGDAADDAQAVGQLVALLDGMPLAIELAAARGAVMPVPLLLQRMSERLALLSFGSPRRDRQATLRATLDWSWDLLDAPERAMLSQLSVFEGGASFAAVEAVVALATPAAAAGAIDVLQSLVEKSLVRRIAPGRFGMLEMVRSYAGEKLLDAPHAGPAALARQRHARFFAAIGPRAAQAERCVELDNLLAAVRFAVTSGDAATAADALECAWAALQLRGPFALALELAQQVLAMPALQGQAGAAARAELVAGWVLIKLQAPKADARRHLAAAMSRADAAGSRAVQGQALGLLGLLDMTEGRVDDARSCLERALTIARDTGDAAQECQHLSTLGSLSVRLGRLDDAAAFYHGALAIARRIGDHRWEGGILGNLGLVRDEQGRSAEAHGHYEQALAIARDLGDRQWEGNTLCNLGLMLQTQGKLPEASAALQAALAVAREIGHGGLESVVLCNLGLAAEAMHAPDEALRLYDDGLRVARATGDRRVEGQVLSHLGLLLARERRFDEARRALGDADALLCSVSDRLGVALVHCARAECEHLAGRAEPARRALDDAATIAREAGEGPETELGARIGALAALIGVQAPG